MSNSDIRGAARELAEKQGWFVFRLNVTHNEAICDGGTANCKTVQPLGSWKDVSSNDPEVIEGWNWSGVNGYGIDCGKSGLVVADQDPGATWPFSGTRVHDSPRGKHFLYEDLVGLGNRAHLQPWGIDVRGVGGLIVGPGSWHPHGEYVVSSDVPVVPPPPELLNAVAARSSQAEAPEAEPLPAFEARTRLEGVYARMSQTPVGQRNDMLNKLSCTAAGLWVRVDEEDRLGELDQDVIKARLLASVTDDDDPAESEGTFRSGWAYGLAHPAADDLQDPLDDLFNATETLRHIRQAAHSRLVGAPALLCYVVGRVIAEVSPSVALPPVVGGRASLNLGVAVVGDSGAGKSALLSVSRELLGLVGAVERNVGSGEGLVQQFLRYDKTLRDNVVIDDPRRILLADEIDQLGATQNRSGATIAPTLRSALTGGPLGQANATAERNRHVPAGTYRLVLVLGVQPTRSATLLDDSDAGTPQRLVWVKAADPTIPDEDVAWPGPLDWELPDLTADIGYPDHIKAEVRAARRAQAKGGGDSLAGHKLLTRLKVATGLALLHQESDITDQWWELAGRMLEMSMAVQADCKALLSEEVTTARRNLGRLDSIRQEGAAEARDERVTAMSAAIWRKVQAHADATEKDGNDMTHEPGQGCTTRCVGRAVRNFADRAELRDLAVADAVDSDWVEERDGRWFPGTSRPAESHPSAGRLRRG